MKRIALFLLGFGTTAGFAFAIPAPAQHNKIAAKTAHKPAVKTVKVDFDRDVRPILSENCFACHGFDSNKRQAGLRLDVAEIAKSKLPSGSIAIVPGKPNESAVYLRVASRSMPPASSSKTLTAKQIATLKQWIAQGGEYKPHWAFVPPQRPAVPKVKTAKWVKNPIDAFVLAKLEKLGLKPSPEADRRTLIRRVTFDLTGLPPTAAEVAAFAADRSPNAYEKVVDRLLASPHYGERMALAWLDLARYADTHGYHIDSQRDMWRWRDWVIDAFNSNLPYDQFTVRQLAGDLLPNATLDEKIATGFNRNHPINFEGGAIPEEYAAAYIFDRIDTTATTFMGLTMRCAQCHDHKYDPITNKEYYKFYAFFNNVPEQGLDGQTGNAAPFIKAPNPEQQQQMDGFNKKVAEMEQAVKARQTEVAPQLADWIKNGLTTLDKGQSADQGLVARYAFDEGSGSQVKDALGKQPPGTLSGKADWQPGKIGTALKLDGMTAIDAGSGITFDRTDKFSYGAWVNPVSNEAMTVVSRMDEADSFRGWDMYLSNGQVFVHLINKWETNAIRVNTKMQIEANKWHHLFATYDGSGKAKGVHIYVDGKPAELDMTHDSLTGTIVTPKSMHIGMRNPGTFFKGLLDEVRVYNRELTPAEVQSLAGLDSIRQILLLPEEKRTPEQKDALQKFFLDRNDEPYRKLNADLADRRKQRSDLDAQIPTTMVMQEMEKPRDTFILVRGQYDRKGEKVTPGTPSVLPPLPYGAKADRLALANWLVSPSHPLTSRVAVNRFWQMLFGAGLVRTSENFGTQGEQPTHPELLDWLAKEFMEPNGLPPTPSPAARKLAGEGVNAVFTGVSLFPVSGANEPRKGERVDLKASPSHPRLANLRERDNRTSPPESSPFPAVLTRRTREGGSRGLGTQASGTPWDMKRILKLMVMSATYRQSSKVTPLMAEKDPENRLLARMSRSRLPAEVVRDQALSVSGLLVDKIGGPSVKPYQPAGLWEELSFKGGFSAQYYVQDHGENLYRRSMYTFWKRTVPPPSLQTFDAPEREFCMVRRSVTNTPLQALVLMNDPTYLEASRRFAERILTEGGPTPRTRIAWAYQTVLGRAPKKSEAATLQSVLNSELLRFGKDEASAEKYLSIGESKRNDKLDVSELAAWTTVASILFNLDETITKG